MTSPFPGMDPYLEGYIWPDVHHRLAPRICELLSPQIRPDFVARMNTYTVMDTQFSEDVGILYPDVEILRQKVEEPAVSYSSANFPSFTPATLRIPSIPAIEVRIPVIEIRDRDDNRLITAIEILSPVNKRKPGLEPYRKKRIRYYESGVHLLEIDLIRRGKRPFHHSELPKSHYLITLVRAGRGGTDLWAFDVRDALPVLPIPLETTHPDAVLDLGEAMKSIYDRGDYDLSMNYKEPPPPPAFNEPDQQWMQNLLQSR